jgi:hypothetical protein
MSLEMGGVFDINGNWRNPHGSHACGTDVDLRATAANGRDINQRQLRDLITLNYPGAFMIREDVGGAK